MAPKKRPGQAPEGVQRASPYHHGSLRTGLLEAAERILERDGIQGLTLRAAAREAGVSHAAPKNHFGDLSGLLSELAAVGFHRFVAMLLGKGPGGGAANPGPNQDPGQRMGTLGRGYVAFARAHPGLFLLMFRSERLDMTRPALRDAVQEASNVLAGAVSARREETVEQALTLPQAAGIVGAWSLVHGFSMLLLDGRLRTILTRLPVGTTPEQLLGAIFESGRRDT